MITKNAAYSDGQMYGTEVMVDDVKNGVVSFREIYGWHYGCPKMESRTQKMGIDKFSNAYPSEIEFVEAF